MDDEEYWSAPSKRNNLFDDNEPHGIFHGKNKDTNESFASKLRASGLDDPVEPLDTIDWSGNVVSTNLSAAPKRPPNQPRLSARGTVNASKPSSLSVTNGTVRYSKTVTSEPDQVSISSSGSHQMSASNKSHKRSVSDASGRGLLDNPSPTVSVESTSSIDEAIRRDSQPSITETAKLMADNKALERKILSLNKSRWSPMSIADTVSRIISGEKYSLEPYKSLRSKLSLLDAVVGYHDGNAILSVIIFLKKTLSKSLFYEEIRKRPDAVNQYLAFLKIQRNDDVAIEMGNLARNDDAAMWRFKEATEKQSIEMRQVAVSSCYSLSFRGIEAREFEAEMVNEYGTLLNKQIQIEPADARSQQLGHPPFRDMPRRASLYFQPLITTLFYCCLYHYVEPESSFSSALIFKKEFKLTEKQYLYTALRARCKVKDWKSIEMLFTAKNWRGKAKFRAPMKFEKVVEVLAGMHAQQDIIDRYLRLVEDTDVRLEFAHRYGCPLVVIDTLAELRDRQRLEKYREKIRNTQAENHLELVLRNPNNKWKN